MENTVFNSSKLYSQENANILEELLDRKTAPFVEIMKIFFPDRVAKIDIDSYLIGLIKPGVIRDLINQIQPNILLCFFTQEYFYLWFVQRWLTWRGCCVVNIGEPQPEVYVNRLLSFLIDMGDLPPDIPAYYDDIFDYNSATVKEIFFHEANYCSSEPAYLTYFETINLITKSGYPQSSLKKYVKKKACMFLEVATENTRNSDQLKKISSIECLREANCGNASYKTRYIGLERLKQETIEELFKGKTVRIKDKAHYRRKLEVQVTDIESKFHTQRYIVSCVQRVQDGTPELSNEFKLKDTWYLSQDIHALILEAEKNKHTGDESAFDDNHKEQPDHKLANELILTSESQNTECPPSILVDIDKAQTTPQTPIKIARNRPVKHPEFQSFIKKIIRQGYFSFIQNLEDYGCQFEKETDYIKYVQSTSIVREKSKYKTDNTSGLVQDIAIIRKASYKTELEKKVIVYRLREEISNIQSNSTIKEHRKIPLRTVQDYFTENS
jgi:hypothetical protein